jgi:hypothetical protein
METLDKELLEQLETFEMTFDDGNQVRFSEMIGEEFYMSSLNKQLTLAGMGEHIKELKALKRKGQLDAFFDDGWLHLGFDKELLEESFINKLEFD